METTSVWRATAPPSGFGLLQDDLTTDVLIIGGGITGLTLALLLAREEHSVVLLEADTFGAGSTGNSTGNLYQTLSRGIYPVMRAWDQDVARQVLNERGAAIDFIEGLAS